MEKPRSRPVVGIGMMVVNAKDQVLLGKRKGAYGQGYHHFPGGKLDRGESFATGGLRELREECGDQLRVEGIMPVMLYNMRHFPPRHFAEICLATNYKSGEAVNMEPEKCESWEWYSLDKLPSPLFPTVALEIRAYQNLRACLPSRFCYDLTMPWPKGASFPISPDFPGVGIGVMVVRDRQILMARRKTRLGLGQWAFPGGKLESGETFVDCAVRETMEEAGIEVAEPKFQILCNMKRYLPDDHYVGIGITCQWVSGKPKNLEPRKRENWKWFDIDDLPRPLFAAVVQQVQSYREELAGRRPPYYFDA